VSLIVGARRIGEAARIGRALALVNQSDPIPALGEHPD
jgi:hypothetical protein